LSFSRPLTTKIAENDLFIIESGRLVGADFQADTATGAIIFMDQRYSAFLIPINSGFRAVIDARRIVAMPARDRLVAICRFLPPDLTPGPLYSYCGDPGGLLQGDAGYLTW